VRNEMKFHLASRVEEVLQFALEPAADSKRAAA
jgi:hypothetical protein